MRDFVRMIVASNSKRLRDDKTKFTEAEKKWNLEKLYEDLRAAKQRCGSVRRKVLTDTEKCHLRGLLCGYSPEEIAKERGRKPETISTTLSTTLYCYIKELLDYTKEIKHWGDVRDLLEKAGYKVQVSEQSKLSHSLPNEKETTLEISHNANPIREWRLKSVDQLWSKDIGERISGIRKLERIAKDYPTEHWAIMEELAEFIRIQAPRQEEEELSPKLREDIQAALTIIGQRDRKKDPENQRLDLSKVNIAGAKLMKAQLQGAFLYEANLEKANLIDANLQEANLRRTNLKGAWLHETNLRKAYLNEANLQEAELSSTDLQWASLNKANLQRADLRVAKLQGANLSEADLRGANLSSTDLQWADLNKAKLQGTNLSSAKVQGASFHQANLQRANLGGDRNLTRQQIESANVDRITRLLYDLETPEK